MYPILLFASFIAGMVWNSNTPFFQAILWITLILLIALVAGFFIIKSAAVYAFDQVSEDLGFTEAQTDAFRQDDYVRTSKTVGIRNSILLSLLFAVFYIKSLFGKGDDD